MRYSLSDAARATGRNRSTIQRAIKSGRISAARLASGAYEIDPSELHRVFPPVAAQQAQHDAQHGAQQGAQQAQRGARNGARRPSAAQDDAAARIAELEAALAAARARSAGLEEQRQQLGDTVEDLRSRLDRSEARVTALLAAPPRRRRGWWPWGRS